MAKRCRNCGRPVNWVDPGPHLSSWNGWYHTDVPKEGSAYCTQNYHPRAEFSESEFIQSILEKYQLDR